jgi:hypothetical protein
MPGPGLDRHERRSSLAPAFEGAERMPSRLRSRAPLELDLAVLVGGLFLLAAAGCDDNPATNDGTIACDHIDADGLVVEDADSTVAAQWQGAVTGGVAAEAGHLGPVLTVTFLDEDSTRVEIPAECEDHSLSIEVAEPAMAAVEQPPGERWSFQARGLAAGATTFRVRLWHGDHADFTSQPIPLEVAPGEEHEPAGLVLRRGGQDIASIWEGVVTGEVEVPEGAPSDLIALTFLDEDSLGFEPPVPEHSLQFTIADSAIAGFRAEGDWGFRLAPKAPGQTSLTLILFHEDHPDYTSPPIPVHVVAGEVEATALVIRQQGTEIATWNFDPVEGPNQVFGQIIVDRGATLGLAASFLDETGGEFAPEDPDHSLVVEIASSTVARATVAAGGWGFEIEGLALGSTSAVFSILHEGHLDFTSGAIPILVTDSAPGPGTSFLLRKNGIAQLIVVDGVLVPDCGPTHADPGRFETPAGTLTELYSFRLLAPDCSATTISAPRYSLAFEVADSGFARIVNHPEHWDEITIFHLEGLAAGETTVRLRLLDQGQVALTSPPIPVVITPTPARSRPGGP